MIKYFIFLIGLLFICQLAGAEVSSASSNRILRVRRCLPLEISNPTGSCSDTADKDHRAPAPLEEEDYDDDDDNAKEKAVHKQPIDNLAAILKQLYFHQHSIFINHHPENLTPPPKA